MEATAAARLHPPGAPPTDFAAPAGEAALAAADSVAWRVFKNPVALFVGGVAAVILELAEPRVRTGVWEHSGSRSDPVERLRRTGLAAMVTVYGARSQAEAMIAGVRRAHGRVQGQAENGQFYRANDPELLDWVQGTAMFGFLAAYRHYVRPVPPAARNLFYADGLEAALRYGAVGAPRSEAELERLFETMKPELTASPVLFEFLRILGTADILPRALRPVQRLLIRAAVEVLPDWFRSLAGLGRRHGLRSWEAAAVRQMGAAADRIRLDSSPAAEASLRLGLPRDYLWKAAATSAIMRASSPS